MRLVYPQSTPASADGRTCATFRSRRAARHRRRPARGGSSQPAVEPRRRPRTPVHRRVSPPRLSADLGRPGRRSRGAALGPGDRVIAIASGGCNVLSYLTADPAEIIAVDLNGAHVALGRTSSCAASRRCPITQSFFDFFGRADSRANVAAYRSRLRRRPRRGDAAPIGTGAVSRAAGASRRSRATFYRHGLLGRFIGAGHAVARLLRRAIRRACSSARSLDEQRALFEREIAPHVRQARSCAGWRAARPRFTGSAFRRRNIARSPATAQDGIAAVLKRRGWSGSPATSASATIISPGRRSAARYAARRRARACRPICSAANFETLRDARRPVEPFHGSFTERLKASAGASLDAYVLLDAQDWMNDRDADRAVDAKSAAPRGRARASSSAPPPTSGCCRAACRDAILGDFHYEAELRRELGRARPLLDLRRASISTGAQRERRRRC